MRLSQLARKLGTTQSEMIRYVQEEQPDKSLNAHTKLDESLTALIKAKFDPTGEKFNESDTDEALETSDEVIAATEDINEEETEEFVADEATEENEVAAIETTEVIDIPKPTEEIPMATEDVTEPNVEEVAANMEEAVGTEEEVVEAEEATAIPTDDVQAAVNEEEELAPAQSAMTEGTQPEEVGEETTGDTLEEPAEDVETIALDDADEMSYAEAQASANSDIIRAKLVKLEGIKVVGKIDLPPPPKPKEKSEESTTDRKREPRYRDGRRNRKRKEPLSFKEKQERDKKREERARVKQEKATKAKKKQHYYERMEQTGALKSMQERQMKAKTVKSRPESGQSTKKSKNPVKRLWHWLNGKYDD